MNVPPSGIIEAAVDALKGVPQHILILQRKELEDAIGVVHDDFNDGYNLGLQTARLMLETSTLLQMKGIKAEDIL